MQIPISSNTKLLSCFTSGNRTRKVIEKTGGIVETRYYLSDYKLYKRTVSGVVDFQRQTTTLSDGEKVFARIEQKDSETPVVRYQFDNHLGSASLELDTTAAIISYEEYHPFGSTAYRSGKTETEVSLKRYKYASTGSAQRCGKERDEETGLYYYGARYHAAWLGRFVSVDPLATERYWLNPYNYCQNNPINRVDPDGMLDNDPPVVKEENVDWKNFDTKKQEIEINGPEIIESNLQPIPLAEADNTFMIERELGHTSGNTSDVESFLAKLSSFLSKADEYLNLTGGYAFTSKNGNSEETRGGDNHNKTVDADTILAAFAAVKAASSAKSAAEFLIAFSEVLNAVNTIDNICEQADELIEEFAIKKPLMIVS